MGYCQGLNFIVGAAQLQIQKEEDVFWMIVSVLINYKYD
jgi:hypothetical protein